MSKQNSVGIETATLSVGKYSVEQSNGASLIFTLSENGERRWVASTSDPATAMEIVEGLVLVETKRFYYPESAPTVDTAGDCANKNIPAFLKRSKR